MIWNRYKHAVASVFKLFLHLSVTNRYNHISCGGGRRLADGLHKQHVRTIRLLVWDTLEDFSPTRTSYVGQRQHITCTYVDEGRISTGWHTTFLATGRASIAGTIITLTWVFMVDHVEETMDRGQRGDPGSLPAGRRCPALANLRCIETRWKKDMGGPLRTTGIARGPQSQGWLMCKVYVMPCASSR
jgi:hypothetical protein